MRVAMLLHKSVEYDSRVRREARALAEAGHAVTVVELDPAAQGSLDGFARLSASPPAWVRRALPFHGYRVAFLGSFIRRLLQLRPDVVHAHDAAMLLPGLLGARLTGARLVYDSHELATGVPYRDGAWARFVSGIERLAVPRAAAVITVTEGIADRMQQLYRLREKPTVVRNVTELEPPASPTGVLRERLGIGEAPLVLHQGAPAPDRGCEQLIAAVEKLNQAHLAFLGSSPFTGYEDGLRAQATEAGVEDRVHFIPSVPLARLLEYTADADVGVSLLQDTCENHRLALPNKVFEYAAAGVPVVASELPELVSVVHAHGLGWTVDPASSDALSEALRDAIAAARDPATRARVRAAGEHFCWTRERERLVAAYRRLDTEIDAVLLVRNGVRHDARVLRAANVMEELGFRPVVVGVATAEDPPGPGAVEGSRVIRLQPRSPFIAALPRTARPQAQGVPRPPTSEASVGLSGRWPPALRRVHRLATTADYYRRGIWLMARLRPRLVHANDHNTMWIGVIAKLFSRCRLVYDAHELWPDRNGRWEWRPWLLATEWLFVRLADQVITTSPGYAERMARRYGIEPPMLVRNVPAMAVADLPQMRQPSDPFAVYVGGLMPGRGLEQAIDALALAPGIRLRLIGPGRAEYRAGLSARARANGVEDRIEWRGAVTPREVVPALAGAALGLNLIQPICESYELTLPNKLFEYLAAGIPILSSDVPVSARFVEEHQIGEVVGADDVVGIAGALRRLASQNGGGRFRLPLARTRTTLTWGQERNALVRAYGAVAPDRVRRRRA